MSEKISIGIVAPSSQVPRIELDLGIEALKGAGFSVRVHPQVRKSHMFFAGTDEERARAFYDWAVDPRFHVLWGARGGYGATRVLPLLERMTAERGIPERKLLVGYSDATVLLEYVRTRWGWAALHGPMPSMRAFTRQSEAEWGSLLRLLRGERGPLAWKGNVLKFQGAKPKRPVQARLVGGNLAMWAALAGTPFEPISRGKILFFEDLDEPLYRVDRMVTQLLSSGGFEGVKAIVLGDFQNCKDRTAQSLAIVPTPKNRERLLKNPEPDELRPLRKEMGERTGLLRIFGELAERIKCPLAYDLPAGHGPRYGALPLGAEYILHPAGRLEILEWPWYSG